jgi:Raf kinase inhibitor-like YbhB/YbcL family protein
LEGPDSFQALFLLTSKIKLMEQTKIATLTISSSFEHEGIIPSKYTCDGEGINPPLKIGGIPDGTKTLALIMEDLDAPNGIYDHWLVWNIAPKHLIAENSVPGTSGINSTGKTGYLSPCPPYGSHRYYFHIYALDATLDLQPGADKKTLRQAIKFHVLAKGSLMGHYQRTNTMGK